MFDGMSRGEKGHGPDRRERGGRADHQLAVWRWGGAQYVVIQSLGAMRLCFGVQDC